MNDFWQHGLSFPHLKPCLMNNCNPLCPGRKKMFPIYPDRFPRHLGVFALAGGLLLLLTGVLAAQESTITRTPTLSPGEIDRIVRTFTGHETQFRQALNQYSFK